MAKIIWTEIALEDLRCIYENISKDSKVYADKFISKVVERVEILQSFPNLGRVVPEFNIETTRELIIGNYRVVYQVNSESVGIIRIHHSAKQLINS